MQKQKKAKEAIYKKHDVDGLLPEICDGSVVRR